MSKAAGQLKRAPSTNQQYGTVKLGQTGISGANPRAGQQFHVGLTPDGRVVHLYTDGTRIVLPKPTKSGRAYQNPGTIPPAPSVSEAPPGHHALLAALAAQYARELGQ